MYAAVQVPGHEIPPGALVTVPPPDPVVVTLTCGLVENHAAQARSPVTVSAIVGDAPLHWPLQPVKVCPGPGVAVRVTADCSVNRPVQAGPQSSPVGALVTVPAPPIVVTAIVCHAPAGGLVVAIRRPAA